MVTIENSLFFAFYPLKKQVHYNLKNSMMLYNDQDTILLNDFSPFKLLFFLIEMYDMLILISRIKTKAFD
jgi:hypothetical protein